MDFHDIATIDFETEGIEARPHYPPKPVGVSVTVGYRKPLYLSWGHPTGNNCTLPQAQNLLYEFWTRCPHKLFHNSKFDYDVGVEHMKMPTLPWDEIDDTLYLLFLNDPHSRSLSLKPSAEKLLKLPPEEQDLVKEWVLANVPEAKQKPSTWGAYICRAPAEIVGPYANGDVSRTFKIFKKLYSQIARDGMLPAYNRERQLMPILLRNEQQGIRVDVRRLKRDIPRYEKAMDWVEKYIFRRLGKNINLDANVELAEVLQDKGFTNFLLTPKGNISVSKDSLQQALQEDQKLFQAIGYRNRLNTCLTMFMVPWMLKGEASGGYVNTTWHQVRHDEKDGKKQAGARSGRLIATDPNLLNLSTSFEGKDDGYSHPRFLKELPELPLVRVYMLPDEGHVWARRDYNQQELRLLAHYENGGLLEAYQTNPKLDVHNFVRDEIHRVRGILMERKPVKITNFGMIYGMGLSALAKKMGFSLQKAKEVRNAQRSVMPDVQDLDADLKQMGRNGEPLRTWGSRLYYAEPPRIIDGERREYYYKLLNYLIQPSAADVTKEALIRYDSHPDRQEGRFLVTVYDEVDASMPKGGALTREMRALRESMESVELDLPLLSDGESGRSWGEMKDFDDKRTA